MPHGTESRGLHEHRVCKQKIIVVNGVKLVCHARATFNGVAIFKNGKERKITIKNFTYVPELTEYLFSITYALQEDFHVMDEDKTLVLF